MERTKQSMKILNSTRLRKVITAFLTTGFLLVCAHASGAEFTTEPDKTMAAAHESFVKGDTKKAGEDFDKASDYVKKQPQQVFEGSNSEMDKAGTELDNLADGVKRGAVKSDADVKKTFAKVDHQMADCWHKTAAESKRLGKDSTADLKKAGDSLAGAAKWSGHQLDEGTQKTLEAVKKADKASEKGIKADAADVDKWFDNLGHSIADFGHRL
jgi:hypothetical protein